MTDTIPCCSAIPCCFVLLTCRRDERLRGAASMAASRSDARFRAATLSSSPGSTPSHIESRSARSAFVAGAAQALRQLRDLLQGVEFWGFGLGDETQSFGSLAMWRLMSTSD